MNYKNYKALRKLGEGAQAVVFLVVDTQENNKEFNYILYCFKYVRAFKLKFFY